MDDNLKNVIKKSIPSQIENINDWYKFYITTYELFDGFSINTNEINSEWLNKTNDTSEFKINMKSLKNLMVKLK